MIPKGCKRLAEVDFPIAIVSKHSAREKSIRHGHPSTLHLWWARRPLSACRAMLLGLLLPDPCDPQCPKEFKAKAAKALLEVPGYNNERISGQVKSEEGLRKVLLTFIGDVANWDAANNPRWIDVARELIKAAHPEETPLVVDPFAGGGSIPLEALRLGCEAFASDLNPVACLILKVMLEDIPRFGSILSAELRQVGKEIKEKAEKELAEFYPKDPDGATPIAYLWARTVRCESPNCGAEVPVFRSAWLSRRSARKAQYFQEDEIGSCVVLLIDNAPLGGPIHFRIARGHGSEKERTGYNRPICTKAPGNNANVICPCCGTIISGDKKNPRVAAQLVAQSGGANVVLDERGRRTGGSYLLAVATIRPGSKKRTYRLSFKRDYDAVQKAQDHLQYIRASAPEGELLFFPDEGFHSVRPSPNSRGLSAVTRYGMTAFSSLYTSRQLASLAKFAECVRSRYGQQPIKPPHIALQRLLALTVSRVADYCSAESRWDSTQERNVNSFGRQALPMLWDFAELVPIVDCVGSFDSMMNGILRVIERQGQITQSGQVQAIDATEHPLPDRSVPLWFTDPPYYDSVPYADLSDFFYVWLKRMLGAESLLRGPNYNKNRLTPKARECVWNRAYKINGKEKDPAFFEDCVARSFAEGRRITHEDGIGCVVFAHKTTEGWEAMLSGLSRAGWIVTGSWPIATEQTQRLVARDSAALATSVHLVCRPRTADALIGDWGEVLRELPKRVGDWLERLQEEGVRGADLIFACIGPALEIFSRFRKVETAEGREVTLAQYLEKVWEVVGRTALEQVLGTAEARARNGAAGAVEEDARLTALFLWTLQSTNGQNGSVEETEDTADVSGKEEDDEETVPRGKTKGYSLVFDVVRRFAQPLGIDLSKWEGRIIETKKGVVRLMAVSERAKQLFGEDGAAAAADWIVRDPQKSLQQVLFPELEEDRAPKIRGRGRRHKAVMDLSAVELQGEREATTLDRVHAAMLLQAGGQANALRQLIKAEQERGSEFIRLANALSALYPKNSEEKRLLDAMLLAAPR